MNNNILFWNNWLSAIKTYVILGHLSYTYQQHSYIVLSGYAVMSDTKYYLHNDV
jgi:hypothetical protein